MNLRDLGLYVVIPLALLCVAISFFRMCRAMGSNPYPSTDDRRTTKSAINFPKRCPATGNEFFMLLDHPKDGLIPTYGGPYDSYSLPFFEDDDLHKNPRDRTLYVRHFDHDKGYWVEDEDISMFVVYESYLIELEEQADRLNDLKEKQEKPACVDHHSV